MVGHRRGENPRFEHKEFFCACKSAAQRRDGGAGQIRSVTERSGVSPVFHQIKRTAERLSFPLVGHRRGENPRFEHKDFFCARKSDAQRRGGSAGQIRSVTELSGFAPHLALHSNPPRRSSDLLWWGTGAVRSPRTSSRRSFAHAKAPRSGGKAAPAKSEVSRSEAEYPPIFRQIKRDSRRAVLSFGGAQTR